MNRLALLILLLASLATAQWGADLGPQSQYVSRGYVLDAKPVLWPDAWYSWKGATLLAFANFSTDKDEVNETDAFLSYARATGPLTDTVGISFLYFPNTALDPTSEITLATAWSPVPQLSLALSARMDVLDARGGLYGGPSFAWVQEVPHAMLTARASLGFANGTESLYLYGVDRTGWTDISASISAAHTWGPVTATLTASASHRPAELGYGKSSQNVYWAGLSIGYAH